MAKAEPNYTEEMVAAITSAYQAETPVEEIADMIGKSKRSVISKLVREGVYVATEKPTSTRDNGPTKKELLIQLEGLDPQMPVNGLTGATKEAIAYLITKVS
jgi:hypothetical protein